MLVQVVLHFSPYMIEVQCPSRKYYIIYYLSLFIIINFIKTNFIYPVKSVFLMHFYSTIVFFSKGKLIKSVEKSRVLMLSTCISELMRSYCAFFYSTSARQPSHIHVARSRNCLLHYCQEALPLFLSCMHLLHGHCVMSHACHSLLLQLHHA